MFFDRAFGGSPASFMSPGANPQALAALLAMGRASSPGMVGAGPPTLPSLPQKPSANATTPASVPGAVMPPQQNPMDAMKMLEMLKGGNGQGLLTQLLGMGNNNAQPQGYNYTGNYQPIMPQYGF